MIDISEIKTFNVENEISLVNALNADHISHGDFESFKRAFLDSIGDPYDIGILSDPKKFRLGFVSRYTADSNDLPEYGKIKIYQYVYHTLRLAALKRIQEEDEVADIIRDLTLKAQDDGVLTSSFIFCLNLIEECNKSIAEWYGDKKLGERENKFSISTAEEIKSYAEEFGIWQKLEESEKSDDENYQKD